LNPPFFAIVLPITRSSKALFQLAGQRQIGDGYASRANREVARTHGAIPVIPHKSNETHQPVWFARTLYRVRARIEQAVGKLKRFKRVALRCEKTKRNLAFFVTLAAGFILVKPVHTA
jgi:transposase